MALRLQPMDGSKSTAAQWLSWDSNKVLRALVSFGTRLGHWCAVHGDDFTTAGAKADLDWFESELEAKYELRKGGCIGPGNQMTRRVVS
jgi:hypothetical protein